VHLDSQELSVCQREGKDYQAEQHGEGHDDGGSCELAIHDTPPE